MVSLTANRCCCVQPLFHGGEPAHSGGAHGHGAGAAAVPKRLNHPLPRPLFSAWAPGSFAGVLIVGHGRRLGASPAAHCGRCDAGRAGPVAGPNPNARIRHPMPGYHRGPFECICARHWQVPPCGAMKAHAVASTLHAPVGLSPLAGRIDVWRPASGFGIRLDGGSLHPGARVLPYYDSMLIKASGGPAWGAGGCLTLHSDCLAAGSPPPPPCLADHRHRPHV